MSAATSLIAAIRDALASERSACLAAADLGKPIRVRLTVDTMGRIVRVELLAGDRGAESCLQKAFMGLVSATAAQGGAGWHRRDHGASKTLIDVCFV